MNKLEQLDAWILGHIERWAQRIQVVTGYDCFHQRDMVRVVVGGVYLWQALTSLGIRTGWLRWFNAGFFGLLTILYFFEAIHGLPYEEYFDDLYRNSERLLNHRKTFELGAGRVSSFWMAMFSLCVAPMVMMQFPAMLAEIPFTVAAYLDACNPLPPGAGKIRQWINSLSERNRFRTMHAIPNAAKRGSFIS